MKSCLSETYDKTQCSVAQVCDIATQRWHKDAAALKAKVFQKGCGHPHPRRSCRQDPGVYSITVVQQTLMWSLTTPSTFSRPG